MPVEKWLTYAHCIQYDGTNGAEVAAMVPDYVESPYDPIPTEVVSDNGTTLIIGWTHPTFGFSGAEIPLNSWLTMSTDTPDQGLNSCRVYPDPNNGRPIEDRYVSAVDFEPEPADPQVLHVAVGRAALPALLLGGTTSPVAVFDQAMPNANYQLKWRAVSGATVLASIVANGAPTKTTTQVTIPLRANGLASIAGVLLVEVFELADS